jgi:hypothetical protein
MKRLRRHGICKGLGLRRTSIYEGMANGMLPFLWIPQGMADPYPHIEAWIQNRDTERDQGEDKSRGAGHAAKA